MVLVIAIITLNMTTDEPADDSSESRGGSSMSGVQCAKRS